MGGVPFRSVNPRYTGRGISDCDFSRLVFFSFAGLSIPALDPVSLTISELNLEDAADDPGGEVLLYR